MKKSILMFCVLILVPVLSWAGEYGIFSESKTNLLVDDSSAYTDLKSHNAFAVRFKIHEPDTMKTDSVDWKLQTSSDLVTWEDIHTFDRYAGTDTSTQYRLYDLDSILVLGIRRYVRLHLASIDTNEVDTCTSEILRPTGDGTTHDWSYSTGSTYYGVIDEASLDTMDFDSTTAYNKWLVVTCGDHTRNEPTVDSIRVTVRGGSQVDTASFRFGATVADTAYAHRLLSDSTMMATIDSATYSVVFATNPYGSAWTLPQVDSLGIIFQSLSLDASAVIRAAQAYVKVYYHKGDFSPPLGWSGEWILKDAD